jgi:hypothetical protein
MLSHRYVEHIGQVVGTIAIEPGAIAMSSRSKSFCVFCVFSRLKMVAREWEETRGNRR